ncbi:hypothetical protein ACWD5R_30060 [Streptomyces sp. NPDC002514]|uniref:hypothetical protein n=1 Tax=Streptomyces sp. NPDC001270 TaxID=3364554 RepID=UPI0036AD36BA
MRVFGRLGILVGVAALMAGAFTAPAAQAAPQSPVGAQVHAYEWDTAQAGSPPSGMACVDLTGSTACFQK